MARWIPKRRRTWVVLLLLCGLVGMVSRPAYYLIRTAVSDRDERKPLPVGITDDASRLNRARLAQIWNMPADDVAAEHELRDLLAQAKRDGLRVSIAGARHSMGGQTIYRNGIQINMLPYRRLELDEGQNLLFIQAGALWSDVIPYLDRHGRSVAVMQSNNSFSIGGSLSVNCHGWQPNRPPIASTVESLRLMLADGTVVRCSREENQELFGLVLGGYGLFGIILDAQLRVVPNERYRLHRFVVPTREFLAAWELHVGDSLEVGMALGRLSVAPHNFLKESLLYVFTREPGAPDELPATTSSAQTQLSRIIFRTSVDSDYGKELRWSMERDLFQRVTGEFFSRNQLLNQSVEMFANRTEASTDILHEYFVPRDRFQEFVAQLQGIIPSLGSNLLNVTIRDVRTDHDSFLRYADRDMVALVLLFNQPRTEAAEAQMTALTQQLIAAALECRGRYYLPYRLQATPAQLRAAYPQVDEFFERKRHYDPDGLFQNQFYVKYGTDFSVL